MWNGDERGVGEKSGASKNGLGDDRGPSGPLFLQKLHTGETRRSLTDRPIQARPGEKCLRYRVHSTAGLVGGKINQIQLLILSFQLVIPLEPRKAPGMVGSVMYTEYESERLLALLVCWRRSL